MMQLRPFSVTEWIADDLDDAHHRAFAALPSAYVLNDDAVVFPMDPHIALRCFDIIGKSRCAIDSRMNQFLMSSLALDGDLAPIPVTKTPPWRHQLQAYHFAMSRVGTLLAMHMGTGKAQPLHAKVLTPQGWTTIGELRVGDEIINSAGTVSHVIGVYPQGIKQIYRTTFTDGSQVECCDEHLWNVRTPHQKWRDNVRDGRVKSLAEIRATLRDSSGNLRHFIPLVEPVQFPRRDLPVDPYLMGVLIGDGGMSRGTLRLTSADAEIIASVEAALPTELGLRQYGAYDFTITKKDGTAHSRVENALLSALRSLNLMGCDAFHKFIPDVYLYASVEQRLELLRGLMDTDGSIDERQGALEFSTVSRQLAEHVQFLVQSLGGVARLSEGVSTWTYNGEKKTGTRYRLSLVMHVNPFRLTRKAERWQPREKYPPTRAFKEVEYVGDMEAVCIATDAPNELYVTDHCVMTHNTKCTLDIASNINARLVLVICPKKVVANWPREIAKHFAGNALICACDMKKTVKERAAQVQRALRERKSDQTLFIIINHDSAWREPMGELLTSGMWDLAVIDESHKIADSRTRLAKLCYKLRDRARKRLCLSGTPYKQTPIDVFGQTLFLDPSVFGWSFFKFKAAWAQEDAFGNVTGIRHINAFEQKTAQFMFSVGKDVLELPPEHDIKRYVTLSTKAQAIYDALAAELDVVLDETDEDSTVSVANAAVRVLRCQQVTSGFTKDTNGTEHDIDDGKAEALAEWLDELADDEPVVVFARFSHDIDTIRRVAHEAGRTSGEISGKRDDLDRWQRGDLNLLAVQIQAGGVGIDLTRAHYAAYYSIGYSLVDYEQSRARVHRPGQAQSVTYVHFVADGTIDDDVYDALARRANVINHLINKNRKRYAAHVA